MTPMKRAIHAYNKIDMDAQAEYASPYQLTKMLFSGAIKSISIVPMLIERKDFEQASMEITRCLGIVNGLRESLDLSQGEIAENLYRLYSYMSRELVRAYRAKDLDGLKAVRGLLAEIDEAWDSIPYELRG